MHDFGCNDTGFMFFAFLSVGILNNGAAIFEKNCQQLHRYYPGYQGRVVQSPIKLTQG